MHFIPFFRFDQTFCLVSLSMSSIMTASLLKYYQTVLNHKKRPKILIRRGGNTILVKQKIRSFCFWHSNCEIFWLRLIFNWVFLTIPPSKEIVLNIFFSIIINLNESCLILIVNQNVILANIFHIMIWWF